jgi:poly-gamma-glutamate capsule biosynthesis protein CapA/YwtB (metallophosphatase superfamily)
LVALGFDVLTHANNHAFDLGPPGIATTRSAVEAAGLQIVGSGSDHARAARPALVRSPAGCIAVLSVDLGPQPEIVYASATRAGINPLRMRRRAVVPPEEHAVLRKVVQRLGDDRREAARVAVGYRHGSGGSLEMFGTEVMEGTAFENRFEADPDDLAAVQAALSDARRTADLVVVALHNHHWDPDWARTPRWITDLACRLIDGGADLIVGTGAPVLQAMSFYRGKPILSGLGNFIFHTGRSEVYDREGIDVWTGVVCRCSFDLRECASRVDVLPIAVGRPAAGAGTLAPAPLPLSGAAAQAAFNRLTADLSAEDCARVILLDPLSFGASAPSSRAPQAKQGPLSPRASDH